MSLLSKILDLTNFKSKMIHKSDQLIVSIQLNGDEIADHDAKHLEKNDDNKLTVDFIINNNYHSLTSLKVVLMAGMQFNVIKHYRINEYTNKQGATNESK